MKNQISDALQPQSRKKCTTKPLSGKTASTSSPKIPFSNATNQSIPTASAGSSTIVRPGQMPTSGAQIPLNLGDLFDNLKRAGGGIICINQIDETSLM